MDSSNNIIDIEIIVQHIKNNKVDELLEYLDLFHVQDLAEVIVKCDVYDAVYIIKALPYDISSDILCEIPINNFKEIIEGLDKNVKNSILDDMAIDDLINITEGYNEGEERNEFINSLPYSLRLALSKQLIYPEDSAGRLMDTEYIYVRDTMTVLQAIEKIRKNAIGIESVFYIYVVDDEFKLIGVLSLRELLLSEFDEYIKNINIDNVISVNVLMDKEEIANLVKKYHFLAVPVVDDNEKIQGIVTIDDIIDVIEEEVNEDIYRFVGSTSEESNFSSTERFYNKVIIAVKSRLPWLIVTMLGGLLTAAIVSKYNPIIETSVILTSFMPLLAGMGGNVGTQSSTLTVRKIALEEFDDKKSIASNVITESLTGFFIGIICGIIALISSIIIGLKVTVGVIVCISLWANMFTAATIGTLIPFIFKKIGVDPAIASAPFITTTVDITGLSIYFTVASLLLIKFM